MIMLCFCSSPTNASFLATLIVSADTKQGNLGCIRVMNTPEYFEKYNKYEADYVRRLKAKYFSKKSFNGANVFDQEITIENEVIRASRLPCTKPFIDPVSISEEQSSLPSSGAETSTPPSRKNLRKTS